MLHTFPSANKAPCKEMVALAGSLCRSREPKRKSENRRERERERPKPQETRVDQRKEEEGEEEEAEEREKEEEQHKRGKTRGFVLTCHFARPASTRPCTARRPDKTWYRCRRVCREG
jgi:hypothetical protein